MMGALLLVALGGCVGDGSEMAEPVELRSSSQNNPCCFADGYPVCNIGDFRGPQVLVGLEDFCRTPIYDRNGDVVGRELQEDEAKAACMWDSSSGTSTSSFIYCVDFSDYPGDIEPRL